MHREYTSLFKEIPFHGCIDFPLLINSKKIQIVMLSMNDRSDFRLFKKVKIKIFVDAEFFRMVRWDQRPQSQCRYHGTPST